MRPLLRSASRGSSLSLRLGVGLGVALAGGCEGQEVRSAPARAVAVAQEPPTVVEPALVQTGESVALHDRSPTSPDPLTSADRRRFQAAVAEGRRLHAAQDFAGAHAAFSRALDVAPGDPRTLSEQGWSALFAGRLADADAALRQAEALADPDDPRLLASILYNRGRLAELRDQPSVAVDAYQRSLRLRPHSATYQHLTAIPGGTRYVFGAEVRRLQGPYAKLGELCGEERTLAEAAGEGDPTEAFQCLTDATKGLHADAVEVSRGKAMLGPWRGLRFVETRPSAFAVRYHAALRTDEGWFVLPDVAVLSRGTAGTTESVTRLAARAESLFVGGGSQVVLEVETHWVVAEGGTELESETHRVELLCGVGPSGIPSCTGALPRAMQTHRRDAGEDASTRWAVDRTVLPEGMVVLEGDPEELDAPAASVLGTHRIVFP